MILLPLREKVSAKLTDEGFLKRKPPRSAFQLIAAAMSFDPSPDPALRGHPLPQGEREESFQQGPLATRS